MDDSRAVCARECGRYLNGDIQRFLECERFLTYQLPQRLALNKFGDHELRTVNLSDLVNRNEVGMVES